MDLSKLPKMSDTRRAEADRQGQAPPPSSSAPLPATDAASPPPYAGRVVAVDAGGSGWISLIIGVLVLLFWPRFWQWLLHKSIGTAFTWTFTDTDGSPLAYEASWFFWGDLAIALFGLALLLEGAVLLMAAASRAMLWISISVVAAATVLNAGFVVLMLANGQSLQFPSLLAAIFGVFMCVQQWQLLHGPRRRYLLVEE